MLSYQDWCTKRISLLGVLLFGGITIGGLLFVTFPIYYEMVLLLLGTLLFIKAVCFLGFGKNIMGNGDLLLLLPLFMSLYLEELPLFLIAAGVGGVITARVRQEKQVPFVPALSLSYLLVLVMRFTL